MKVSGERTFDAPRQVVWDVLNDPAQMAGLMPGVESFEIQDDTHWSAKVKVPLGLGSLPLSFSFEKAEDRPIEHARLNAKGKGVGAMISLDTQFDLSEADGGGTTMAWAADVHIAGPVGSMGQRVLQPVVNQQVGNVLDALDKQVMRAAAGGGGEAATGAEEGIHPGSPEAYSSEPEGPTHTT
jgi:carbon monoxide dehydrogenase subunit G